MIGVAALVAAKALGLAGEVARIGAGVAMRGVLDQLLLGFLEPLGHASTGLGHGALLLAAAFLKRQMFFLFHGALLDLVNPARRLYLAA
jgi:hypothetical protein